MTHKHEIKIRFGDISNKDADNLNKQIKSILPKGTKAEFKSITDPG